MEQAINLYLQKRGFKAFTPKAVFFDMDGVLFDSMPYHAASWAQTCTSFGLEMDKTEAYNKNMFAILGNPGYDKETEAIKARLA